VYAAGFVDALLLTPILKNSLAGMGVPIRCFEGMIGIVSKPVQKRVGRLTLFQGISQVLSHRKTT